MDGAGECSHTRSQRRTPAAGGAFWPWCPCLGNQKLAESCLSCKNWHFRNRRLRKCQGKMAALKRRQWWTGDREGEGPWPLRPWRAGNRRRSAWTCGCAFMLRQIGCWSCLRSSFCSKRRTTRSLPTCAWKPLGASRSSDVFFSAPTAAIICAKDKKETELDIIRIFAKRDIKKLIKAIHNAGGIAVLAHPACCWAINLESFVKKLISYGLDGIEVYYPYKRHRGIIKFHTAKEVERIADKYNLIKTGGTDLHGTKLD